MIDTEMNSRNNRLIPFEGSNNFRDMGGYQTEDGRHVKYGLIYRSDELTGLTENDLELFQTLNIKSIFDYRDGPEARFKPDPVLAGVQNIRIPANTLTTTAPNSGMEDLIKSGMLKTFDKSMFKELYKQLPIGNPSYKRLMNLIQDPAQLGLLHHCTAGKDRTGVGSAIILLALGVDKATIMEDYLLTNVTMKDFNDAMLAKVSSHFSDVEVRNFETLLSVDEEFMEAVFERILSEYGSTDVYLEQEFGLNADKRTKLRAYCLE